MGIDHQATARLYSEASDEGSSACAFLIRVGRSHLPLQPDPLMINLTAVGDLRWGRGDQDRSESTGPSAVQLELADPSLSTSHARIMRLVGADGATYVLEDLQSTNGCRVNGLRLCDDLQTLEHGDIIETGQTFWKFWHREVSQLEQLLALSHDGGAIRYTSSVSLELLEVLWQVEQIAPSELPVILEGESGTGKEGMARHLHDGSGRDGPFVALNCATIPEGLIESELFGHRKGAFTGAEAHKPGLVEVADGGTLLLDEVGDMPLAAQAKLLRVLQERSYMRLGETRTRHLDVRFIASTLHDLRSLVHEQRFRGDLYARLNGLSVTLPALRHRKEDLGLLLATFIARDRPEGIAVAHDVFRTLVLYDWEFNIRELEKVIAAALTFARGSDELRRFHLPAPVRQTEGSGAPKAESTGQQRAPLPSGEAAAQPPGLEQQAALMDALRQHAGNITLVAQQLQTSRMQVYRWLKRLQIDPQSFR